MHIDFEQDETETETNYNNNNDTKQIFSMAISHRITNQSIKKSMFNLDEETEFNQEINTQQSLSQFEDHEILPPENIFNSEKLSSNQINHSEEKKLTSKYLEPKKKLFNIDFSSSSDEEQSEQKEEEQEEEEEEQQQQENKNPNIFEVNDEESYDNENENHNALSQIEEKTEEANEDIPTSDKNTKIMHIFNKTIITKKQFKEKDRNKFMFSLIRHDELLKCLISRRKNFENIVNSQYDMKFISGEDSFIASCRKNIGIVNTKYVMSLESEEFEDETNIIGRIKQTDNGIEFNIYDEVSVSGKSTENEKKTKKIFATVHITSVDDGPRETTVYILKENSKFDDLTGTAIKNQRNLKNLYEIDNNKQHIAFFRSKKPIWMEKQKDYFLSFRGQAKIPSIRNFILENPETSEEVLLFGKQEDNLYNINISYPLTPRLGFAIVIPQLEFNN